MALLAYSVYTLLFSLVSLLNMSNAFVVNAGNRMRNGKCVVDDFDRKDAPPTISFGIPKDKACEPCYGVWEGDGSPQNVLAPNEDTSCLPDGYNGGDGTNVARGICMCGAFATYHDNALRCIVVKRTRPNEKIKVTIRKNGDCTKDMKTITEEGTYDVGKKLAHCVVTDDSMCAP